MTRWLLDDGPLGHLARSFDPAWVWPAYTLFVMEEVAAQAFKDKTGRRQRLLEARNGVDPLIGVDRIDVGSPADEFLFGYLRPEAVSSTKNRGEHAAIAFCARQNPESIFVTMDKGAAYLALAELGPGRVSTPFDVWMDLRSRGIMPDAAYEELCRSTFAGDGDLRGKPSRLG